MGSLGAKKTQSGFAFYMTNTEIAEFAKNKYNMTVPEKVLDKIGADKIVGGLILSEDLFKELPEDVVKQAGISFITKDQGSKAYASMQVVDGTLQINPKLYDDNLFKSYASDVAGKWHPDNTTADSIIVHEIAHRLDWLMHQKEYSNYYDRVIAWNSRELAKNVVLQAISNAKATTGQGGKISEYMNSISGYAASKKGGKYQYHETIAEGIADYVANKNNAKPLSKEIWKIVKSKLGG